MKKQPHSIRTTAAVLNVSHTLVNKTSKLRRIAEARGFGAEFESRMMAGERIGKVVKDLMPDVHAAQQYRQRLIAFRSNALKLMEDHGFTFDDLIDALDRMVGPASDVAEMAAARAEIERETSVEGKR